MLLRPLFVTNSSSTSVIGWGVYLSRSDFKKLGSLPAGVDYQYPPSDDYVVYVPQPEIRLNEDGTLKVDPLAIQNPVVELKALLKAAGLSEEIYYIEESWYDG